MDLIVTGHVRSALTYNRQVVSTADLKHLVGLPLVVLPRVDAACEFAEVDLWVEVCRKPVAMVAGIDIDNINRLESVEVLVFGQCGVGIYHAWVEATAQNRCRTRLFTALTTFPFVVAIPRRLFTDLQWIFVDRCIQVSRTGFNTSF